MLWCDVIWRQKIRDWLIMYVPIGDGDKSFAETSLPWIIKHNLICYFYVVTVYTSTGQEYNSILFFFLSVKLPICQNWLVWWFGIERAYVVTWTYDDSVPRHGPLARNGKLRVRMRREFRERFPRHRGQAIPACITALFPLESAARKTFPAFPAHARPAILRCC